ncbi:MAG: CrtD protein, partial [Pseudomonadota bacterium]
NLPADGDRHSYSTSELEQCLTAMDRRLAKNGLTLLRDGDARNLTAPDGFNTLFPATGGALYGQASHGWMASFSRPGTKGRLAGLYLAGGSVHPGPGIPMAALSGKLAADQVMADAALTGRSRPAVISGGMSTRPATAAVSPSRSSPS